MAERQRARSQIRHITSHPHKKKLHSMSSDEQPQKVVVSSTGPSSAEPAELADSTGARPLSYQNSSSVGVSPIIEEQNGIYLVVLDQSLMMMVVGCVGHY
jgi:hypothetical protein